MDLQQISAAIEADEKRRAAAERIFADWYERKISRRLSGEDDDQELRMALFAVCRAAFLAGVEAQ